jgi:hypothetical protein
MRDAKSVKSFLGALISTNTGLATVTEIATEQATL